MSNWKNEKISQAELKKSRVQLLLIMFFLGLALAPLFAIVTHLRVMPENKLVGASMVPHVTKQNAILTISPKFKSITRFDVVSVRATYQGKPTTSPISFVKRVIGLPGETIRIDGQDIFVNGEKITDLFGVYNRDSEDLVEVTLAKDEYFLMGDNRSASQDSRDFGPFKYEHMNWVALYIFPPDKD